MPKPAIWVYAVPHSLAPEHQPVTKPCGLWPASSPRVSFPISCQGLNLGPRVSGGPFPAQCHDNGFSEYRSVPVLNVANQLPARDSLCCRWTQTAQLCSSASSAGNPLPPPRPEGITLRCLPSLVPCASGGTSLPVTGHGGHCPYAWFGLTPRHCPPCLALHGTHAFRTHHTHQCCRDGLWLSLTVLGVDTPERCLVLISMLLKAMLGVEAASSPRALCPWGIH